MAEEIKDDEILKKLKRQKSNRLKVSKSDEYNIFITEIIKIKGQIINNVRAH